MNNPRSLLLSVYISINVFFAALIYITGTLYGEVNELDFDKNLVFVVVLIAFFYITFNSVVYKRYTKHQSFKFPDLPPYSNALDLIIITIQLSFLYYFYTNGLYSANSTAKDSSLWSYFWVLLPADLIFLVYYGYQRKSKYFKYNLFIALISSILRGWTGLLLTVLYLEVSRVYLKNKIPKLLITTLIISSVLLYPFLLNGKLAIRNAFQNNSPVTVGFLVDSFTSLDGLGETYGESLFNSTVQLFSRIQIVSHAIAIVENIDYFKAERESGKIYSIWFEGIHGLGIDILSGKEKANSFTNSLAAFLDPKAVDINWNVNPTIVGWILLDPFFGFISLIYILFLCRLSASIANKMPISFDSQNLIWYAWLVYIVPGWIAPFVLFIYAQFIFFLLTRKFARNELNCD